MAEKPDVPRYPWPLKVKWFNLKADAVSFDAEAERKRLARLTASKPWKRTDRDPDKGCP